MRVKTVLTNVNAELLDSQLKQTLTTAVCFGVTVDPTGVYAELDDNATPQQIQQALTIAAAHDPAQKTAAQTAEATNKVNWAAMNNKADQAITDLSAKLATFQSAQTLQNAAPLLIECTQDMIALIKAFKLLATRIPQ